MLPSCTASLWPAPGQSDAVPWLWWSGGGQGLTCLRLNCQQTPCTCWVAYAAANVVMVLVWAFWRVQRPEQPVGRWVSAGTELLGGRVRPRTKPNSHVFCRAGCTALWHPYKCTGPEVSWLSFKPLPALPACDCLVTESPSGSRHSILLFYR